MALGDAKPVAKGRSCALAVRPASDAKCQLRAVLLTEAASLFSAQFEKKRTT